MNALRQAPLLLRQFLQSLMYLQIEFLQDRYLKEKVNISARHHSVTQDLQAWNRLLEQALTCLRRGSVLKKGLRQQGKLLLPYQKT